MGYINEDWLKQKELELAEKQVSSNDTTQDLQALQFQQEVANTVREQLDLSEQIDYIEHLLRGHILKFVEVNGKEVQKWVEPESKDLVVFTDYGVHLIMNQLGFYLNKNTLLSNYETDTILQKMKDFAHALNRLIFLKLEKVFVQPTNEECINLLKERIEKKTEMRKFAYELVGKKVDENEIRKEFIEEIEKNIEKEIQKIREKTIEDKYKQYEMLIREVQDIVHSTYLRAWNGQERRTLRQIIHITENTGMMPVSKQQKERSRINPLNFFRRG